MTSKQISENIPTKMMSHIIFRVELFSVLDGSQSFVYLKHPKTALDYDKIMVGGGEVGHGTSWGCICCFIKEKNNPVKGGFKVKYFWGKIMKYFKNSKGLSRALGNP